MDNTSAPLTNEVVELFFTMINLSYNSRPANRLILTIKIATLTGCLAPGGNVLAPNDG